MPFSVVYLAYNSISHSGNRKALLYFVAVDHKLSDEGSIAGDKVDLDRVLDKATK